MEGGSMLSSSLHDPGGTTLHLLIPVRRAAFGLAICLLLSPHAAVADCPSGDLAGCTAQCDAGDGAACSSLGGMYRTGGHGVARDETRAVELYRRACNLGSAKGCTNLREMYSDGRGVKGEGANK
jgi:TPR repeat protein